MQATLRPWLTTGIAIVSASAVAIAPISPIVPQAHAAEVRVAPVTRTMDVQLTAIDWPYLLSLPIVRQQIRNWAQNWAVYLGGLAKSGIGVAQSLLSIPGVTVEVIQEVLALNFVGAFETVTTAIRDSVIAIGQPLLDSVIWRNQKALVVEAALRAAVPQAIIDVTNGFLVAGNEVVTSLIVGTQNLVAAILSFDLGNIVDAAVDGTVGFVQALGTGAGAIVDGIESAQLGIATALATPPPPPPGLADVSTMRTMADTQTITITSKQDEPEQLSASSDEVPEATPMVEESASVPEAPVETADPSAAPVPEPSSEPEKSASAEPEPSADPEPATPPKKVRPHPIRDVLQKVKETVDEVTAGAEKSAEKPKPVEKPAVPAEKPATESGSAGGEE